MRLFCSTPKPLNYANQLTNGGRVKPATSCALQCKITFFVNGVWSFWREWTPESVNNRPQLVQMLLDKQNWSCLVYQLQISCSFYQISWCLRHRGQLSTLWTMCKCGLSTQTAVVSIRCVHPACSFLLNLHKRAPKPFCRFCVGFLSPSVLFSVCICESWSNPSCLNTAAWWVTTCFISWGYITTLHKID